ncbi:hypothetical protein ACOMHN_025283 [Nucella lapillus]
MTAAQVLAFYARQMTRQRCRLVGMEYGPYIIKDPEVKSRELFISKSNATDTFAVSQLRGKCQVVHYQDIVIMGKCQVVHYQDIGSARAFKPCPDVFFYVLGYNPQTKRLATTQGEIRVGASHQAALPECKPDLSPIQMPEEFRSYEELRWQPNRIPDTDLFMFLQAARSIAAFAGMCDGAEPDTAAAADETTSSALDILHKFDYDTAKALQALVKCPAKKTLEKKWGEEDSLTGQTDTGVSGFTGQTDTGVSGFTGQTDTGVSGFTGQTDTGVSGFTGQTDKGVSGFTGQTDTGVSGFTGQTDTVALDEEMARPESGKVLLTQ